MGIFGSDYTAKGSVSAIQIGEQRNHDDSYLGELLLQQSRNKRSMADEIRHDIFHGVTYTFRKFARIGKKNNFTGKIGSSPGTGEGKHLTVVNETVPDATAVSGIWAPTSGYEQGLADLSRHPTYNYKISTEAGYIATTEYFGTTRYIVSQYVNSLGIMEFEYGDGTLYETSVRGDKPTTDGFFATIQIGDTIDGYSNYYFSTDQRHNLSITTAKNIDTLPVISLKDNDNGEQPYYLLDPSDSEYQRRDDTIKTLGIDFYEMSKEIFDPTPIPEDGSDDWNSQYGNEYRKNDELQSQYPSETAYHNSLVTDMGEMKDSIKNITDAHVGMFVTPKTLDWSNVFSMRAALHDILPGLDPYDEDILVGVKRFQETTVSLKCGSLLIRYEIGGYEIGKVVGDINDFNPSFGTKHMTMENTPKNKARYGVIDDYNSKDDDPANSEPPAAGFSNILKPYGAVAIAVQTNDTSAGESTYSYIKIWDLFAEHTIDVVQASTGGGYHVVKVFGTLKGMDELDYSDVFILPLTYNSIKAVSMFKRERLMRESTMIIIDGIQVSEVKWYQKGVFQVVFTVLAVIISCYLSACTSAAGFASALEAFAAYAVESLLAGIAITVILQAIDNPFLAALVVIISAVALGRISMQSSAVQMATLAVEATGTYLQKKLAYDMKELMEKTKESRTKLAKAQEDLDEWMKDKGIVLDVDTDYALDMATLPPPGEMPDDYFKRVLNRDLCIINQTKDVVEKRKIRLPNRKI